MNNKKPLKRLKELKPFSRDHHHGLLLGWKIRNGIKKGIETPRIAAYVKWFFQNYLSAHFELEEKYMFPILGMENDMIKRAINDHLQMRTMIAHLDSTTLSDFADLLEQHIRFEERELFGQIQETATPRQLAKIEQIHHDEPFIENPDEFWK